MTDYKNVQRVFKIIDNEEFMRDKVFGVKNPGLCRKKVGEMQFLRNFVREMLEDIKKLSSGKNGKIYLGGKAESWDRFLNALDEMDFSNVKQDISTFVVYLKSQLDLKRSIEK